MDDYAERSFCSNISNPHPHAKKRIFRRDFGYAKCKCRLSDKKLEKLKKVEEVFNRCGTLEATGQELGLTRERIRQLLRDGKKYGVIDYLSKGKRKRQRLEELK